jgi:uncharacterized protein YeaO (DUF488 family)
MLLIFKITLLKKSSKFRRIIKYKKFYYCSIMIIEYKRIYDHDLNMKGSYTIFIDKMYPRGIRRDDKRIKNWVKDIAPNRELITWFHKNINGRWSTFKKQYKHDLMSRYKTDDIFYDDINDIIDKGEKKGKLLILYSSRDIKHNNARVFADFLKHLMK